MSNLSKFKESKKITLTRISKSLKEEIEKCEEEIKRTSRQLEELRKQKEKLLKSALDSHHSNLTFLFISKFSGVKRTSIEYHTCYFYDYITDKVFTEKIYKGLRSKYTGYFDISEILSNLDIVYDKLINPEFMSSVIKNTIDALIEEHRISSLEELTTVIRRSISDNSFFNRILEQASVASLKKEKPE